MGKIFVLLLIFIIAVVLWSLPLYLCVNLVLWLFNVDFHLTLIQSFGICLLTNVLKSLLFKGKGDN